jgi:hypothetical protein
VGVLAGVIVVALAGGIFATVLRVRARAHRPRLAALARAWKHPQRVARASEPVGADLARRLIVTLGGAVAVPIAKSLTRKLVP